MWLFTTGGFFSIVEHKDDPNCLLVRARIKGDIERYWPTAEVQRTEDADYLYRAKIPRKDISGLIAVMIHTINYTSFKGAVEDKARYWNYYSKVNEEMQIMQEEMEHESHSN